MSNLNKQNSPGRNDPCPCGSGKKYKKCCGSLAASPGGNVAPKPDFRQSLQRAYSLFQAGQLAEVSELCTRVLAVEPGNSAANDLYGLLQYRQGNLPAARKHLEVAVKGDPRNYLIHNNLCHITELLGDLEVARKHGERAIKLNPRFADAYNNLGNVLVNQVDSFEDALKHYRKALTLAPDNPKFLMNLAAALHKNNQFADAEAMYKKVLETDPNWIEVLNNLGALKYQQKNYIAAREYFMQALAVDPKDSEALLNLAKAYRASGDILEAEACLIAIEKTYPNDVGVQLELASLYQKFGWLEKMEQACRRAAELEPENPRVFKEWAQYEEGRHQLDRAVELLEKAESLGLSRHNLLRARIARRFKQWETAEQELRKLDIELLDSEEQYRYFYDLGYVLDKLKRYDEAWEAFCEATKKKKLIENIEYNISDQKVSLESFEKIFNSKQVNSLSKASRDTLKFEGVKPIFIVGFPRSGTTLLEQILCSHPNISAGDELPYIGEIGVSLVQDAEANDSTLLGTRTLEEQVEMLQQKQQFYLDQVDKLGVVDMKGHFFTDKMPLNLNYLSLIHLLFPDSPIIHIIRNPMDSCLSSFFSHFGTGNLHSLDIVDCAEYFRMTFEYAQKMENSIEGLNLLQIRYEDLVSDQEKITRQVIDFVGEPWDEACLSYHLTTRISRTISYEQVTSKIYTSSVSRYLNYEKHLSKALEILSPQMESLGYSRSHRD